MNKALSYDIHYAATDAQAFFEKPIREDLVVVPLKEFKKQMTTRAKALKTGGRWEVHVLKAGSFKYRVTRPSTGQWHTVHNSSGVEQAVKSDRLTSNEKGLAAVETLKNYGDKPALNVTDAAQNLGISRTTLYAKIRSKGLIAFPDSLGRPCIPQWQFDEVGHILPGIAECLKVLKGPEWAIMRFFIAQRAELGMNPLSLLREGRVEEVLTLAKNSNPAPCA